MAKPLLLTVEQWSHRAKTVIVVGLEGWPVVSCVVRAGVAKPVQSVVEFHGVDAIGQGVWHQFSVLGETNISLFGVVLTPAIFGFPVASNRVALLAGNLGRRVFERCRCCQAGHGIVAPASRWSLKPGSQMADAPQKSPRMGYRRLRCQVFAIAILQLLGRGLDLLESFKACVNAAWPVLMQSRNHSTASSSRSPVTTLGAGIFGTVSAVLERWLDWRQGEEGA